MMQKYVHQIDLSKTYKNKKLKIAIYAICKNESKFIKRWMNSILSELDEDDKIIVFDTGSTDDSIEQFQTYDDRLLVRINTPLSPFRFDVARNIALNDVPTDIDVCIKTDLDEVFHPGWRNAIINSWNQDYLLQRLRVTFIWNHDDQGKPDRVFKHDCMIHSRHGYAWQNACHEIITCIDPSKELIQDSNVTIEHFADNMKPRSSYLDLLKIAKDETPSDQRTQLYYARELWFQNQLDSAYKELEVFLKMENTWNVERAYVLRIMAKIAHHKHDKDLQIKLLLQACGEAINEREPWIELSEAADNNFTLKTFAALMALKVKERPQHYLSESRCWSSLPHDLISVGAYYDGIKQLSLEHAQKAVDINPMDFRLQQNLNIISSNLK